MKTVQDSNQMAALKPIEGLEVYVVATNLRYRVMAGCWIAIGAGPGTEESPAT